MLTPAESAPGYDTARGQLHSRLGLDPLQGHYIWGADLHLTPDATRLVCSERGEWTLAVLEVVDGALTRQLSIADTRARPRGFVLSPDGGLVLAVGEKSTDLALSRLEADGTLTLLSRTPTGAGANWCASCPLD